MNTSKRHGIKQSVVRGSLYSTLLVRTYDKARVICVDGLAARQLHDAHSSEQKETLNVKLKVKLEAREAEALGARTRSLEPNDRATALSLGAVLSPQSTTYCRTLYCERVATTCTRTVRVCSNDLTASVGASDCACATWIHRTHVHTRSWRNASD